MITARRDARPSRFPLLTVQGWFRVAFAVLAVLAVAAVLIIAQLLAAGRRASGDLDTGVLPARLRPTGCRARW